MSNPRLLVGNNYICRELEVIAVFRNDASALIWRSYHEGLRWKEVILRDWSIRTELSILAKIRLINIVWLSIYSFCCYGRQGSHSQVDSGAFPAL